jgi:apolipoprotein N-acyltransferase
LTERGGRPLVQLVPLAPSAPLRIDASVALALGALHSLALIATGWWALQLLAVGGFAWQLARAAPGRAALLGGLFGTAWLGCSIWWLFISLHRYGGLPAWMAGAAVLALCVGLALCLAAAMAAFARWRRGAAMPDALLFAAVWLLAELARGTIFTGFPWAASGYAHVDGPLAALAPWVGVYGMGFVGAALPAWVALQPAPRLAWRCAVAVGVLLGVAHFAPVAQFSAPTGTLTLSLLQSNVAQDEKFAPEFLPQSLAWAGEQLLAARGELVIGPETVIPLLPAQLDPGFWQPLLAHFQQGQHAALIGLPLGDEVLGYTNSVAGVSRDTAALPGGFYRYDKNHLVPFGEFVPTGFRWFTQMMNIPLGDFNRGPRAAASFVLRGERIAPNICYEDLFGEELAERFAEPATAPTIFANISNIGWFGDTMAVDQHLVISRLRALEFQRPMVRATNTGATVVIDHGGVVRFALAPHTRGVLDAEVQGRSGLTPFARWAGALGLWPLALLAVALVLASARRRRP